MVTPQKALAEMIGIGPESAGGFLDQVAKVGHGERRCVDERIGLPDQQVWLVNPQPRLVRNVIKNCAKVERRLVATRRTVSPINRCRYCRGIRCRSASGFAR